MSIDQMMYVRRGTVDAVKEKLADLRRYESAETLRIYVRDLRDALTLGEVGRFFVEKYRTRGAEAGFHAAASQLRKQGVPLSIALRILLGVNERVRAS